jgi:hypothetical protein
MHFYLDMTSYTDHVGSDMPILFFVLYELIVVIHQEIRCGLLHGSCSRIRYAYLIQAFLHNTFSCCRWKLTRRLCRIHHSHSSKVFLVSKAMGWGPYNFSFGLFKRFQRQNDHNYMNIVRKLFHKIYKKSRCQFPLETLH